MGENEYRHTTKPPHWPSGWFKRSTQPCEACGYDFRTTIKADSRLCSGCKSLRLDIMARCRTAGIVFDESMVKDEARKIVLEYEGRHR